MPLTDAEKARVKYHLGYPNISTAAGISFGVPVPLETAFLVDSALTLVQEVSLPDVRRFITIMDGIEERLVRAQSHLAAEQLGELRIRRDEPQALEAEYRRWGYRLADTLSVPVYPYSRRYQGGGFNVSVVG